MDVVSQNMIAYKLNQNIEAQKLLQDIQKLIQQNIKDQNPENFLLVVRVQQINYNDDSSIPKLEYKP